MVKRPEPIMGTEKDVAGRRVVAIIIDTIVLALIFSVLTFGGVFTLPAGLVFGWIILVVLVFFVIWFFYSFLLEGYMGQTIGKKAMGIVVVKEDGSPCGYIDSLARNFLRIIDGLGYYLVGIIAMLLSERRQRIGDRLANTVVVKAK